MPWLVRWCIADYLDYASWFQLQSVVSCYRNHPPDQLTFDGSCAYEGVWNARRLYRIVRFRSITEDDLYGGVVRPRGSIGVLLQLIKFGPRSFSSLTVLDLSKQITDRYQVSELFSPSTASVFLHIKSVSLRISLYSDSSLPSPNSTVPPANVENVTLNVLHWRNNDNSVINPVVPLFLKAKKLSFILDESRELFPFFEGQGPFENLVELEVTDKDMAFLNNSHIRIRETFPRLSKFVFKFNYCDCIIEDCGFRPVPFSWRPLIWSSNTSDRYREFGSVKEIQFTDQDVECNSTLHQCVNASIFSWFMPHWDGVWLNFLNTILLLKEFKHLREFRLPRQFFMVWSKFASFRYECSIFAQTRCAFPSVQSLHFIPEYRCGCVSYFSAPTIPQGEIADGMLRHMFEIFPNVKTLSIAPVPLLEGGDVFRYLTVSTKLTTLMILHTRRIQRGRLDGRLNFRAWLPDTKTLDAFLLYTEQLFWSNEAEEGGLLDCLKKNRSLRYVCIICDVANSVGHIGLSASTVEAIGSAWYNEQQGGSQGRYLILVFLHRGSFSCLAVKPKTKKCRKAYTFERNNFSTWWDLERAYPELYSVFWRNLSLYIDFRERVINI